MDNEQYKELFITESEEHLRIINNSVLKLEKDPGNSAILNEIFRSAHTLKGMSATMGFDSLTKLTHKMEDILDTFRSHKIPITTDVVDILFECLDMLEGLLEEIKTEKDLRLDVDAMVARLETVIPSISSDYHKIDNEKKEIKLTKIEKANLSKVLTSRDSKIYKIDITLTSDCQLKSVRVFMVFNKLGALGEVIKSAPSVEDLEVNRFGFIFSLLFLSGVSKEKIIESLNKVMELDVINVKPVENINVFKEDFSAGTAAVHEAQGGIAAKKPVAAAAHLEVKKIQSIRVSTQRLDKLMNFVGELVIAKIRLIQIARTHQLQPLTEVLTNIDRLTGDLQDEVMQARLIPMSQVFDRFPRMIRDLANTLHKQVSFEVTGGEIEMDRTVLDEIADPLVHLLRNSVDHGIELPEERKNNNKNPIGTIRLSARRERTYVLIEVSDNGKGIDPNLLRVLAVRKGFMTEEEVNKLVDKEVLNIITLPGFSSSSVVTDTSGRGVGMDVVKTKIESLGGSINFDSQLGKGSVFSLKLPLTVAIIRAMLVEVEDEIYAVPIANIAETIKIFEHQIKRINKFEVINLRNEVLPLLRMQRLLNTAVNTKSGNLDKKEISIVVVEVGAKKAGLVVERVHGQQEVVIKSVGSLLKGIKGFSGATILGDGRVALILDVATLVG